jgi:hypothetical protein
LQPQRRSLQCTNTCAKRIKPYLQAPLILRHSAAYKIISTAAVHI